MSAHPTYEWKRDDRPWACECSPEGHNGSGATAHEDCRACVLFTGAIAVNGAIRSAQVRRRGRITRVADGNTAARRFYEKHRGRHSLPPLPEREAVA